MKRAVAPVTLAALLTLSLLLGCRGGEAGSGRLITETYDYSNFTRINVDSAFRVEVTGSGVYGVQVTIDDNLLKYVEISQEGETLKIGRKPVTLLWPVTLEAKVALPELRGLTVSEATRGTVSNFHSMKNLTIELSGASRIELVDVSAGDLDFKVSEASQITGGVTAEDAAFTVSGASTIQLSGSASDLAVNAGEASKVELSNLLVKNVNIKLSGASTGAINVEDRLDADLSGASRLTYSGNPTMGTISTAEASSLSWK